MLTNCIQNTNYEYFLLIVTQKSCNISIFLVSLKVENEEEDVRLFGYIRVYRPELKVKENEYYRALYCGLCREMGRCTGQCSRASLSYDLAFFSIVRMALSGTAPTLARKRCIAHPFKRRTFVTSNGEIRFSACVSAMLTYHKVRDDLHDERGFRRFAARLALPFATTARRRAKKKYPNADTVVELHINRLSLLEKNGCQSADEVAAVFGEMMGMLLAFGYEGSVQKIAHSIGLHVGKWTYLIDAADDLEKDAGSGAFNPMLRVFPNAKLTQEQKDELFSALLLELSDAEAAIDLIDNGCPDAETAAITDAIIKNILYLGMPNVQRSAIYKDEATASSERQSQ